MNANDDVSRKCRELLDGIYTATAEISADNMRLTVLTFPDKPSLVGKSMNIEDVPECFNVFPDNGNRAFSDILNREYLTGVLADGVPKKLCFSVQSKPHIYSKYIVSLFPRKHSGIIYLTVIEYEQTENVITLMFKKNAVNIRLSDIYYVDYGNHSVEIHSSQGKNSFFSVTFNDVAEMLLKYPNFMRSYKNCIVNMDRISAVDGDSFIMDNGDRISIPKRRMKEIKQHFENYKIME